MLKLQLFIFLVILIVVSVIFYLILSHRISMFKDVGPFYSFGPENVGMYLIAQQRMKQGLDHNYVQPLQVSKFADVCLLLPNGIRPLETFYSK